MIYRIKIVKDGKFVRYAIDEELMELRVNSDGKIEALVTVMVRNNFAGFQWQDVSDTHEVEWGLYFNGNKKKYPIYVGDILSITEDEIGTDTEWVRKKYRIENAHQLFGIWSDCEGMINYVCMKIRVIGNANVNHELLEEK